MTEDDMVEWHHRLDGQEFEQALKVGDGLGSFACCAKLSDNSVLKSWVISK